jgi:uncharacterized protein YjbJ (UPF0337 family)
MSDQPTEPDVARARGSIKEAIGKITGDRDAIREGAAEKTTTDARDAQADELKQQGKAIRDEADGCTDKLEAQAKQIRAEADKRADVYDDRAEAVRQ